MKRPIAIGLGPNTTSQDAKLAIGLLLKPWQCVGGLGAERVEGWFEKYFDVPYAVAFNSGRSALYVILKSLGIGEDDEVLLQAFTCVVVPNAILGVHGKPIYVDIDETLTMDVCDLERKITKRTKAIIVQHTLGISSHMSEIMKIGRRHKIVVIEDVAHTIGGKYKGQKLGTIGDAAIFSFGRDKAFSSTFGGIAITRDRQLGKKLEDFQKNAKNPGLWWTMRQLWYPVITLIILDTYYLANFGKALHLLLAKMKVFSFPVTTKEKQGIFEEKDVKKYPNALAQLALIQLSRLEAWNKKRSEIVASYIEFCKEENIDTPIVDTIPLLRFPILVKNKHHLKKALADEGVYIGDWYTKAIDPKDVAMDKVSYQTCVRSEEIAQHILNLPTYASLTKEDVMRIKELVKNNIKL